jgi:hypothetical protein
MGGSSGGGGGSSGKVDYPDYMKSFHSDMLNNSGADTFESSVVDACNAALGASPFSSLSAYNPDTPISDMEAALASFNSFMAGLSTNSTYSTLLGEVSTIHTNTLGSTTYLNNAIAALSSQIAADIGAYVVPAFKGSLRDINAVHTSAFATGEAMLYRKGIADAAKFGSDLYMEVYHKGKIQFMLTIGEIILRTEAAFQEAYAKLVVDMKKMKIIAKKEQAEEDKEIDVSNAKWDLEVFQYAGNALASIGSGTVSPNAAKASKTQSALSGAMAGASVGALAGGVPGAAIGAAIGGVAGLLM